MMCVVKRTNEHAANMPLMKGVYGKLVLMMLRVQEEHYSVVESNPVALLYRE